MWVRPGDVSALIKPGAQRAERQGLGTSEQVFARVLEGTARAPEALFAGLEFLWQSHRWQTGQGHRSSRNAAAAIHHLKTETVGHLILLCLMHFHQHVFLRLR